MTEQTEIRAKALELAILYLGPRGPMTGTDLKEIDGDIERRLSLVAAAFEKLITGEPSEWGVLR